MKYTHFFVLVMGQIQSVMGEIKSVILQFQNWFLCGLKGVLDSLLPYSDCIGKQRFVDL